MILVIASKYGSFVIDKKQTTFFQNAFTPNYASPEQIKGEKNLSEKTDIYSLGVVLYQTLTGQLPLELSESDSYPKLISTLERQVPSLLKKSITKVIDEVEKEKIISERDCQSISELKNNLSNSLDELVQKALSQKINKRYANVNDFEREITDYLSEESFFKQIRSAFAILYRKLIRRFSRFSWKWAVGAVLLFLILSQTSIFSTSLYFLQIKVSGADKASLSNSQKKALENSVNLSKQKVLNDFNSYIVEFEKQRRCIQKQYLGIFRFYRAFVKHRLSA